MPKHGDRSTCRECEGTIEYIECAQATGLGTVEVLDAWWAHVTHHPGDAHEAVPVQLPLNDRIIAWHTARFPNAEAVHVGLKLCSEAGEVADAIVGDSNVNSGTGDGDVRAEAADVYIALTVLLGRWYDTDLLAAVEAKLAILETPGAHKSSAL